MARTPAHSVEAGLLWQNAQMALLFNSGTAGWTLDARIFNLAGAMVRHLVKNALAGSSGSWYWNGLDGTGRSLPAGQYIVNVVLFALDGKTERIRRIIVLAK